MDEPKEATVVEEKSADAPVESAEPKESAEQAATEQKSEEKPAPPKDKLSKSWEKLAKTEKTLREEQKKLSEELESFKKSKTEFEETMKLFKENPVAWFEKHAPPNLYEDLTKRYLNGGEPSTDEKERKLQERLEQLEKSLKGKAEEEQKARAKEAERSYRASLDKELESPEFELIRTYNAKEDVIELVVGWANAHGEILTPRDAAAKVEAELEEQLKKATSTKKFSEKIASTANQKLEDKKEAGKNAKLSTLSNSLSAANPVSDRKNKSRDERLREAAEKLASSMKGGG